MERRYDARIAIYGWDDSAPAQLEVLDRVAGLRPVAVGDRRPATLVQARSATGLPCYQHVLEMLRGADYDVALINASEGGPQAAQAAAARGAALIVAGAQADASTLIEAAEAALRYHVPLTVLRPRLQQAGLAFALRLAAADPGWRPRYLDVALEGPAGATALLHDAVAIATRLFATPPVQVIASFLGNDADEATTFSVHLRYADGRLANLRVREAQTDRLALVSDTGLGTLELRHAEATSTLTMTLPGGASETSTLTDGDTLALEAARTLASGDAGTSDALLAPRDGATLQAIETALTSGYAVAVQERSSRANLHLVGGGGEGGASASTPRSGRVHLVGV